MNKTLFKTFFTFVLCVIVFFIFVIIGSAYYNATGASNNTMSYGMNGFVEQRCISGYSYVVGHDGSVRQTMDEFGRGVKCK